MTDQVPISWYLILSAALFVLGVLGFLIKRNLITVFMSIELMLNGVNLSFVDLRSPVACGERTDLRLLRHDGRRG
jgi:NADH:ubiquinone oxidoreductase subunit K